MYFANDANYIEISQLICSENPMSGFRMIDIVPVSLFLTWHICCRKSGILISNFEHGNHLRQCAPNCHHDLNKFTTGKNDS